MDEMPEVISSEEQLTERLSRPRAALTEFIRTLASPLVLLGAGGKMGPSLAILAARAAREASHPLEIIAVSRFQDPIQRQWLNDRGIKTISCDLFERTRGIALPPRKGRGWASDRLATCRTRGTWPIGASVQARMTSAVRDAPL